MPNQNENPKYNVGTGTGHIKLEVSSSTIAILGANAYIKYDPGSVPEPIKSVKANTSNQVPPRAIGKAKLLKDTKLIVNITLTFNCAKVKAIDAFRKAKAATKIKIIMSGGIPAKSSYSHHDGEIMGEGEKIKIGSEEFYICTYGKVITLY